MKITPMSRTISELLNDAHSGLLKIPSFQRSYVWKKNQVVSLIDSIFHDYPVGSLLFLPDDGTFDSDVIKNSPAIKNSSTDSLVLDGQQRLTSCYHVFYNKSSTYRYYIDLMELYHQFLEYEDKRDDYNFTDCIKTKPAKTKFKEGIVDDWLPFYYLRNDQSFSSAINTYAKQLEDNAEGDKSIADYSDFLRINLRSVIMPFFNYVFTILEIDRKQGLPAICRVFETLNNTGTKLDSFDLCVARFMRDGYDLKEALNESIERYPNLKILYSGDKNREFPLQVIALVTKKDHKKNRLATVLETIEIKEYWDKANQALNLALQMLDSTGAASTKTIKLLPYPVIPVVIAAALITTKNYNKTDVMLVKVKNIICQYFFYTSLNQTFNEGAVGKMKTDYNLLVDWINDNKIPEIYKGGAPWYYDTLKKIPKSNTGALSKTIKCLYYKASPQDIYENSIIDITDKNVDLHHLFPTGSYENVDSIFNLAFTKSSTNRSIGDIKPSEYEDYFSKKAGKTVNQLKSTMESLLIKDDTYEAFISEKYDDFIYLRSEELIGLLSDSFGVKVNRLVSEEGEEPDIEE